MAGVIAAALTALHGREVVGCKGRWSMLQSLEVAANYLETTLVLYTYQGIVRGRTGSTLSPPTPLCDMYETRDGYMIVTSLTQQQRQSLFEMIGHPELVDTFESALSTGHPRGSQADPVGLHRQLGWENRTTEEAFELSQLLRIPCAKVDTAENLFNDKHLNERGFFQKLDHPDFGEISLPGTGLTVEGEPAPPPAPAPTLGEANREIYQHRLGISDRELAMLGSGRVI